ncbi:hypothetical protein JCM9803A_00450 [Rhodococcus erythropolis]
MPNQPTQRTVPPTPTKSGECTIAGIPVAPNDQIGIFGDSGAGSTRSTLETALIDQNPDGTGTYTYTSHFNASDELKNDASHVLHNSLQSAAQATDLQDNGELVEGYRSSSWDRRRSF